ncbi:MAG: hypothetical protein ACF8XB_16160 [Planctomycetota bacterium JB042]
MALPTTRTVLSSFLALTLAAASPPTGAAGDKGFADLPLGGKNDPRIGVLVSGAPNFAATVVPGEDDDVDPCGAWVFVPGLGRMGVTATPFAFPPDSFSQNQFLAIEFPFKITGKKTKKSIAKGDPSLAAHSFLTTNVEVTDQNGTHLPGIVVIGGKTVDGTSVVAHPSFPLVPLPNGKNLLTRKNVLTYVADTGDGDLSTPSAFGPAPGDDTFSAVDSIRIRLHEIAGVTVNAAFEVKRAGSANVPPLWLSSIEPTKPVDPPVLSGGLPVVKRKTDFVLTFSEPVEPRSVGVEKKWMKKLGGLFLKNLGVNVHPCNGSPLFPNVVVEWHRDGKAPLPLGFDVAPVNPNNLTQFRLRVLDTPKKGSGTLTVRVLRLSENENPHPLGGTIRSAVTTRHDVPFDDDAFHERSFRIE